MQKKDNQDAAIEELYLKEKKLKNIYLGVTIVLAIALVGSVLTRPTESDISQTSPDSSFDTRPFGGGGRLSVGEMFDEDGEIDTQVVDKQLSGLPAGVDEFFMARYSDRVDFAVENGEITEEQAQELLEYLGIE